MMGNFMCHLAWPQDAQVTHYSERSGRRLAFELAGSGKWLALPSAGGILQSTEVRTRTRGRGRRSLLLVLASLLGRDFSSHLGPQTGLTHPSSWGSSLQVVDCETSQPP